MSKKNITKIKIAKELSLKTGYPISFSKKLIDDLILCITESIKTEKLYLKNLGRFRVKKGRLDWLIKNLEKKDSNKDQVEKLKKIRNEKFGRS